MGLLGDLIELRSERRSFGALAAKIPGPGESYRTNAGVSVTEDSALHHIDVFKNISLIADSVGMLPLRAFKNEAVRADDGTVRMYARKIPRQPSLLTDPMGGGPDTEFSFKHRVSCSLLSNGNTFNEAAAIDRQGVPSVLMPIDPRKVREAKVSKSGLVEYHMHDGGVMGHIRDGGTMVHWPGFIGPGSLLGMSPIEAGRQGIALGMAAEKYGARWFGDGSHPQGYLKDSRPRDDIDPAEAAETKRKWVATYSGLSREPAYLYGDLDWHPIQISPDESQFIETRQLQAAQISGLYRVPPHLVGDVSKSTSWGTGIEEQGLAFVTYTLGPWLTRMEQAMSWLLPRGQFAKFNVGALLRGRTHDRYSSYAVGRNWGWLSVNDIRELEDLAPLPDGDTYLQPLNMVDASAIMAPNNDSPPADGGL